MNTEQTKAIDLIKQNNTDIDGDTNNIFITGAAGCGKSFVLNEIIKWLLNTYTNDNDCEIGVTASTGAAAVLLDNGRTLHSYLSIGTGIKSASELYSSMSKYVKEKLIKLKILIIDEISMINDILFTKISDYLSLIKNNDMPFGGVNLILVGDFHQLPPVKGKYCFKSPVWDNLNLNIINLTTPIRQNDAQFISILDEIRNNKITKENFDILKNTKNNIQQHSFINLQLLKQINNQRK